MQLSISLVHCQFSPQPLGGSTVLFASEPCICSGWHAALTVIPSPLHTLTHIIVSSFSIVGLQIFCRINSQANIQEIPSPPLSIKQRVKNAGINTAFAGLSHTFPFCSSTVPLHPQKRCQF